MQFGVQTMVVIPIYCPGNRHFYVHVFLFILGVHRIPCQHLANYARVWGYVYIGTSGQEKVIVPLLVAHDTDVQTCQLVKWVWCEM